MDQPKVAILDYGPDRSLSPVLRDILRGANQFETTLIEGITDNLRADILFQIVSAQAIAARHQLKLPSHPPTIIVARDCTASQIEHLLSLGANDFVTTPLDPNEILPRVRRLLGRGEIGLPIDNLKEKFGLGQLIGQSDAFLSAVHKIPRYAEAGLSVLITGATGTGKELFARAIQQLSPRSGRPFIAINCGAVPVDLIENELFGHEPGAYTGADLRKAGLIAQADAGTLFLDEVDCLPIAAQVKLLRFLEEQEYIPLGSAKVHRADVLVIAASNADIPKAVREGRFRSDLFHRLNVLSLALPSLNERPTDIVLLAQHFLRTYSQGHGKRCPTFSPAAIVKLMDYDWPGNVRELKNVIERAAVLSDGAQIQPVAIELPRSVEALDASFSFKEFKAKAVERFERAMIAELLGVGHGNVAEAARAAGKDRRTFAKLMSKYRIKPTDPSAEQ